MDVLENHKLLIERWGTPCMEDCLVQEVYELQAKNVKLFELVLDLQNRVRHLEFQACPIQNADIEGGVKDLDPLTKKF